MPGEEEERRCESQGVSQNFYSAREGEVEPGTLSEGESFIGNVDRRDNDLDGAAKNSLSFSRNSDGNDCFFTALADNPADWESIGSNSVDRSGSVTAASADDAAEVDFNFGSTKGIIRLAAEEEEEEEEEQVSDGDPTGRESVGSNTTPLDGWPRIQGEEAVTSDDAAEVNFNFGSTKGISRPASEEEEEEEQVFDDDPSDRESVGSNTTPPDGWPSIHAEMEDLVVIINNCDLSSVDNEEESEDDERWDEGQEEEAVNAASSDGAADDPAEDVDEEEDGEGENFAENNDDLGARPASRAAVESLISTQIGQEDFEPQLDCVICMDLVSVGEFVIQLPCRHIYHAGCILEWLRLRNTCPSCRYKLPTEDPAYEE